MDALISGCSGRALLVDGGAMQSFDVDDPSILVPRTPADFPYLFGEMQDLRVVENTDIESVRQELQHETEAAEALDLALISLDAELPDEIRREALECLNELVVDYRVVEQLENILYARPLPGDSDLRGALQLCGATHPPSSSALLRRLAAHGPFISKVSEAWDVIPTKIFGNYHRQTEFQRVAVREGVFRGLVLRIRVLGRGRIRPLRMEALFNDAIKQLPKHLEVLQAWERAYRDIANRTKTANAISESRLLSLSDPGSTAHAVNKPAKVPRFAKGLSGRRHAVSVARGFDRFLRESPALQQTLVSAGRVAATNLPLLLVGEAGTGKDLLARAIHEESRRSRRKFITINCGAIPGELIEAELFGYVKGSAGGESDSRGLFEAADHGTLFLDEITETTPSFQVKLLHVLRQGAIWRVASNTARLVDVRVLAGTTRNIEEEVGAGRFRRDLFYRLNVAPIVLPPLRFRREDIHLLAAHFLERAAEKHNRQGLELDPKLLEAFEEYAWPGNVRELKNVIERLVVLTAESRIGLEFFPRVIFPSPDRDTFLQVMLNEDISKFERQYIRELLRRTGGNKVAVARLLEIEKSDLLQLIDRFGLRTLQQTRTDRDSSDS